MAAQLLDAADFWSLTLMALLVAGGAFFFAFRNLGRARLIEDTPTARIRSAPQGHVELVGKVDFNGEPLSAPLTHSPCCWYHFKVERRRGKEWTTEAQGTSEEPFLLDDGTDCCLVYPRGAEVTPSDRSLWYGEDAVPVVTDPPRIPPDPRTAWVRAVAIHAQADLSASYRYSEERFYAGDHLYAIGHFHTLDEREQAEECQALLRERLSGWKRDRAALLARFDANRDGEIDLEEWEGVRQMASAEIEQEYARELAVRVRHSLRRGPDRRRPFLLSSLPQPDLARRHRLYAGIAAALFLAAGAAATYVLSSRFFLR